MLALSVHRELKSYQRIGDSTPSPKGVFICDGSTAKNMRMEMGLWGGEHRSSLAHYRPPLDAPVHCTHYKV